MKDDLIPPAEQFTYFSLLSVQFLTHHHWPEKIIMCMSFRTPCLLLLASTRELVLALHPETRPPLQRSAPEPSSSLTVPHTFLT